jgi:indole-3-glycerol phosphate synthase
MNILEKIIADKKAEIDRLHVAGSLDALMEKAAGTGRPRNFAAALDRGDEIALIGEIKRASPSKGLIREDFDPPFLAEQYERGGASALSVLTEVNYFQGDPKYLREARNAVDLPVLRKDFIVDPHQVPESRNLDADAILLIVAALDDAKLRDLVGLAKELSLAALVEVHAADELDRALAAGAEIVGINNRNLETFEMSLQTTFDLLPHIPDGIITVSESGIESNLDVGLMRDIGVNAILVGESLMRQDNVRSAARKLMGK